LYQGQVPVYSLSGVKRDIEVLFDDKKHLQKMVFLDRVSTAHFLSQTISYFNLQCFMVSHVTLSASFRDVKDKKVQSLRTKGIIPAVMYGHGFDPIALQVDKQQFIKVYTEAGTSSIVRLNINGEIFDTLIHEVDYDPVTDMPIHIDFLRIKKGKKITTQIPLEFVGECSVVKEKGGVLLKELDAIEIRCLPQDLINHIDVDVSVIKDFNEPLHVRDLNIPSTIEILTDLDMVVVTVTPPKQEEEAPAAEASLIPEELKKEQEAAAAAAKDEEKKEKKE
jgi:large subunit ribosomal protein L25